jgi:hypothetical protein
VRELFQTPGGKEEKKRFYNIVEKAEEKTPGVMTAIEDAFYMWQAQETFATQIGFIIGLRIAGISSKRTKAMARTWRPGYPTDDRGPGQRKRQI